MTCLWMCCLAAACGGAHDDTNQAFREIQHHEAEIAEAVAASRRQSPKAQADNTNTEQACHASEQLCDIADDLDDTDAQSRCTRAQHTCMHLKKPRAVHAP